MPQSLGSFVWASGLIPLSIPETITRTFSFFRSDKRVYTTASLRPISSCQPTQAMARPVFSYFWNPLPTFPGVHNFYGHIYPGLGRPNGGFPDFGFWTRSDRKLHFKILELKAVNLPLHQWVSGHQLMITTDNTIVVAYINKQGGTHSHTLLHLVVNLFLWLQTQDIAIGTRHILGCLHVWADTNSPMVATHNCGFHIYYVFVWTTLSSFHTARTYCHKARYVSNGKSCCLRAWCSHAALPSSRIFEEVTRLAAAPRRPSTNTVYDDRWLHFAHWAAGQRIDPLGPTAVQIAPFLYYLFDTEGLSPQSIKGQQVLFSLSP